jgi:hypothetical protein
MVESFSNGVEAVMTYASRLLAGILLIVLPTVMVGGVTILSLVIGDPAYMERLEAELRASLGPTRCRPHF